MLSLAARHLRPILAGAGVLLVGLLILWLVCKTFWVYCTVPVFLAAGFLVGFLTPREFKDYSGNNVMVLLLTSWIGLMGLSGKLFPEFDSISAWFIQVFGLNVLHGFILILGALWGRSRAPKMLEGFLPTEPNVSSTSSAWTNK